MEKIIRIAALLSAIMLISCGTRKVQKQLNTSKADTSVIKSSKKYIEANSRYCEDAELLKISPLDTSKTMVLNGKAYKNAKIEVLKSKRRGDSSYKGSEGRTSSKKGSRSEKSTSRSTTNDNKVSLILGGLFIAWLFLYLLLTEIFKK